MPYCEPNLKMGDPNQTFNVLDFGTPNTKRTPGLTIFVLNLSNLLGLSWRNRWRLCSNSYADDFILCRRSHDAAASRDIRPRLNRTDCTLTLLERRCERRLLRREWRRRGERLRRRRGDRLRLRLLRLGMVAIYKCKIIYKYLNTCCRQSFLAVQKLRIISIGSFICGYHTLVTLHPPTI